MPLLVASSRPLLLLLLLLVLLLLLLACMLACQLACLCLPVPACVCLCLPACLPVVLYLPVPAWQSAAVTSRGPLQNPLKTLKRRGLRSPGAKKRENSRVKRPPFGRGPSNRQRMHRKSNRKHKENPKKHAPEHAKSTENATILKKTPMAPQSPKIRFPRGFHSDF